MKLDAWIDIQCPFCYVSTACFEKAMEELGQPEEVTYVHHAYYLNPDAPNHTGLDYYDYLADAKGFTREEVIEAMEIIEERARANGIEINVDKVVSANTKDVLLLAYYAQDVGLQRQWITRAREAYFKNGENIADDQVLRQMLKEVGLPEEALEKVRKDSAYLGRLQEDCHQFKAAKAESVPYYMIDDTIPSPESKSVDEFKALIEAYR